MLSAGDELRIQLKYGPSRIVKPLDNLIYREVTGVYDSSIIFLGRVVLESWVLRTNSFPSLMSVRSMGVAITFCVPLSGIGGNHLFTDFTDSSARFTFRN